MPFGVDVGLGPGLIVLDGTQLPPKGAQQPPIFGPCLLWPNGWMGVKMPVGTEVGLGPGHIVLDGTQPLPLQKNKKLTRRLDSENELFLRQLRPDSF